MNHKLTVAMGQISPVWLNREATLAKMANYLTEAAREGAQLIAFGEALLPGYPYWLDLINGAEFNSEKQKRLYAYYVEQAVDIERGDLTMIQDACAKNKISAYVGCIEKTRQRGMSVYCTMVFIDHQGVIQSSHRKLMPTYEERLAWAPGDGHGLRVHSVGDFTVGGLNCWENWIPMARQSLYAQGEQLHVAIWPGNINNTKDITRFIAKEARSYVMSVSGLIGLDDVADDLPFAIEIKEAMKERISSSEKFLSNGGSCIAAPDGEWLVEPVIDKECLTLATIDLSEVMKERQNFDPAGHYSRPDVLQLQVNRQRQTTVHFSE